MYSDKKNNKQSFIFAYRISILLLFLTTTTLSFSKTIEINIGGSEESSTSVADCQYGIMIDLDRGNTILCVYYQETFLPLIFSEWMYNRTRVTIDISYSLHSHRL
jgi:hypothetical protein